MEIECRDNIIKLHEFIESWLKGTVDKSKQIFQYFEDTLDSNFIIVHPSGELQSKEEITNDLWSAYGVQSECFSIKISDIVLRVISDTACLLNYEEHQEGKEPSTRISSVLFKKSETSEDYHWVHLHETWR